MPARSPAGEWAGERTAFVYAGLWPRLAAFALDYVLIAGYVVLLPLVGNSSRPREPRAPRPARGHPRDQPFSRRRRSVALNMIRVQKTGASGVSVGCWTCCAPPEPAKCTHYLRVTGAFLRVRRNGMLRSAAAALIRPTPRRLRHHPPRTPTSRGMTHGNPRRARNDAARRLRRSFTDLITTSPRRRAVTSAPFRRRGHRHDGRPGDHANESPRLAMRRSPIGISGFHDLRVVRSGGELPCWSADPDLFFAESPADVEGAKALCRGCPARLECLAGALKRGEPWGVWGGELLVQGVVVPRKRPRGRPRKEPAAA
jgi:WhiB family redox-sensing transcriptional regulator